MYMYVRYHEVRELRARFHKLILFLDRAPQHCHSKRVKEYLEKNNYIMTAEYFPKGSSELSAVEEYWRQGKDDLLVSKYYPRFTNLKAVITNYYRTKRFNLNIVKYLLRGSVNLC
jgi:transposase